jgi:hypothetical protein
MWINYSFSWFCYQILKWFGEILPSGWLEAMENLYITNIAMTIKACNIFTLNKKPPVLLPEAQSGDYLRRW